MGADPLPLSQLLRPEWASLRAPLRARIALQYAALDPTIASLLVHTLPRLLRTLRHTNERSLRETRGELRGRVHWPITLHRQASQGPTHFVVQERRVNRDLPENQLLRWLCAALARALSPTPDDIADGYCLGQDAEPVRRRALHLRQALRRVERDPRLADVAVPARLLPAHLDRARDTSIPEYHLLADAAERFRRLADEQEPAVLFEIGDRLRIVPGRASAETLPWSRVAALLEARRA